MSLDNLSKETLENILIAYGFDVSFAADIRYLFVVA
jgi:hypothetical protein